MNHGIYCWGGVVTIPQRRSGHPAGFLDARPITMLSIVRRCSRGLVSASSISAFLAAVCPRAPRSAYVANRVRVVAGPQGGSLASIPGTCRRMERHRDGATPAGRQSRSPVVRLRELAWIRSRRNDRYAVDGYRCPCPCRREFAAAQPLLEPPEERWPGSSRSPPCLAFLSNGKYKRKVL